MSHGKTASGFETKNATDNSGWSHETAMKAIKRQWLRRGFDICQTAMEDLCQEAYLFWHQKDKQGYPRFETFKANVPEAIPTDKQEAFAIGRCVNEYMKRQARKNKKQREAMQTAKEMRAKQSKTLVNEISLELPANDEMAQIAKCFANGLGKRETRAKLGMAKTTLFRRIQDLRELVLAMEDIPAPKRETQFPYRMANIPSLPHKARKVIAYPEDIQEGWEHSGKEQGPNCAEALPPSKQADVYFQEYLATLAQMNNGWGID